MLLASVAEGEYETRKVCDVVRKENVKTKLIEART